jgi:RHS repeat-associated protein
MTPAGYATVTVPGATPGSFAVTPSGAATYTIPIAIPPGTNGMQPNLSLVYNSQIGNGNLGVGWSLSGLSAVHRCGATLAIDGFKGGVNYGPDDKFCLDGERLINTGGVNYRTQHESWKNIQAFFPPNPTYWYVKSRDGTIYYYGYTPDSQIYAQGQSAVRVWLLNEIQDRNGNYLTITYQNDTATGDYYPDSIAYTGNGASAPYNVVYFDFENRNDVIQLYQGGSIIQKVQILKDVRSCTNTTCTGNNGLVRQYNMTYDNNGAVGSSRLISVQECGSDGQTCLPATTFGWQGGDNPNFSAARTSAFVANGGDSPSNSGFYMTDVSGDGKSDAIFYEPATGNVHVSLSIGRLGAFAAPVTTNIGAGTTYDVSNGDSPRVLLADVAGDGKTDIVRWNPVVYVPGQGVISTLTIYLSNGDGTYATNGFGPYISGAVGYGNAKFRMADVNGDGMADAVLYYPYQGSNYPTSGYVYVFQAAGNGFISSASVNTYLGFDSSYKWLTLADVNGDGRADIVCVTSDGYAHVYLANKDLTFTAVPVMTNIGAGYLPSNSWFTLADVNGDGNADAILYDPVSGNNYVYLAQGDGTFAPAVSTNIGTGISPGNASFTMADYNGDGRADVVLYNPATGVANVYLAKGDGKFAAGVPTNIGAGYYPSNSWFAPGDVNGDGNTDVVLFSPSSGNISAFRSKAISGLLYTINDGLGFYTVLSYAPLTSGPYYIDYTPSYPYKVVQNATYVVSQVYQFTPNLNITTYQYGDLIRNVNADASLGFRWMSSTDPTGTSHVTYYNQILNGTEGTVAEDQTWGNNGVMVKDVVNTWTRVSLSGTGHTLAELTQSIEATRELDNSVVTTVTTTNGYDSYENPTSVKVTYAVGGANDGWQKTTANTFNNDTTHWALGQLTQSQVTAVAPNQSAQTRTSSFTYDSLGRLASEVIEPINSAYTLTTTYGYDTFGNRTSKTLSGSGIVTRTEYQRQYDARGQFSLWQMNAKNQKTMYNSYDPRNGQVTSRTDPNNLPMLWDYQDDPFARLVKVTRPDNTYTTYNYSLPCDSTCPTNAKTMTQIFTVGAGTTYVYRDLLGRELRTESQGFGGAFIYRDTAYDTLGRVASVSEPYYSGATVYYTAYEYDALNRVNTVTEPGNRTTTTDYNGLTTTVTTPPTAASPSGQTHVTVKDSQGHVVQATEAAGTVSNVYDPFGNLIQVTGVDSAITSMTYDIRGRKTSMNDPDMGKWTYYYDVLNELTAEKDAKGQIISIYWPVTVGMAYDVLGRMTSRTTPEGTSTWTYDTASLGTTGNLALGKLASVSNANATETYGYDNFARPITDTTSVSGVTYTASTTYDAYSRVSQITYPVTGYQVNYGYDPNSGLLDQMTNNAGTVLWKINAYGMDAHNRVTSETFGNGLVSQHNYDPNTGYLLGIQTGAGGGTAVQNLGYTFDALGNLTSRTDNNQGSLTEQFRYDEDGLGLNRLTSVTGPSPKTYAYYPNGNIQSKSDVGTYTYPTNGVQPHAVSSIAGTLNTSFTYDANGNMLTGNGKTITYTSFNKPKTVAVNGQTDTLTYDANFNRLIKAGGGFSTIYIGKIYDQTTYFGMAKRHYLYAGNRLVAIYTQASGALGSSNTRYIHTDHLGSVDTITDESGNVVQHLSYDAHGKRRNSNWTDATTTITSPTTRGFTEQEHDDDVKLINMNAREYDYVLGRFITPDTIVAGALNSQVYNRYSYVNNNPLSYTDPTGHCGTCKHLEHIIHRYARDIVAVVAAVYGGPAVAGAFGEEFVAVGITSSAVADGIAGGFIAGGVIGGNLKSAGYGAVTGGAFGEVGDLTNNDPWYAKTGAHALTGGVTSSITGGDFRSGFISAGVAEWASPIVDNRDLFPTVESRVLAAGFIGGEAARLAGGNFNDGFVTAAFARLFNHELHGCKGGEVCNGWRHQERLESPDGGNANTSVDTGRELHIHVGTYTPGLDGIYFSADWRELNVDGTLLPHAVPENWPPLQGTHLLYGIERQYYYSAPTEGAYRWFINVPPQESYHGNSSGNYIDIYTR